MANRETAADVLDAWFPPAPAEVVCLCWEQGVYLRDRATFGPQMKAWTVRVAVRSVAENTCLVNVLTSALMA